MSQPPKWTTSQGAPVSDVFATERATFDNSNHANNAPKVGPLLLQDFQLIDSLAHFDRERIPERVVHAKGAGAFGEFEVTDDITDVCAAKFLDTIGKKTRIFTRFSTVGGEKGSADSARDPRGFSTKFYTEEGNLDLVYNNTPIFFIRDPSKFPHFIHTQKRNPATNLKDANMFWDYLVNNQESIHQVMYLFSDRGTPASLRKMNGYSGHTYKWYNKKGEWLYVQVHFKSDLGVVNFNNEEAGKLAGEDPDYHTGDLFNAIERGEYPTWTCYIQTMTQEQAAKQPFSVFDLTKVWPHKDFPLRRFGKFTLNENPKNYFAEVEQAAFSPSHTIPSMQPSADPVLQSRLFSYPDTHRHRLGVNYQQIPVNCPVAPVFAPQIRDGAMTVNGNLGSTPNYKSSFCPFSTEAQIQTNSNTPEEVLAAHTEKFHWGGILDSKSYDFEQPRGLWKVLGKTPGQQRNLCHNVAVHVAAANHEVQDRVFEYFSKVYPEIGDQIRKEVLQLSPRGDSAARL
ncbi:BA75_02005T0 [Komagataella pastoris]|uniref:Catalase n=1 Tax=Komagataella pastoris TaxID=4922 RepID=A0A1B2JAJ8_PICPA|nr:BA75_02005T0 [Komagataella pastoris]